jgi:fucose permease
MTEIICLAIGFFCGFALASVMAATRMKKISDQLAVIRRLTRDYDA